MASEGVQRTIGRLRGEAEDAISWSVWSAVRDRAQNVLTLDHESRDALAFIEAAEFALSSSGASPNVQPLPAPATAPGSRTNLPPSAGRPSRPKPARAPSEKI